MTPPTATTKDQVIPMRRDRTTTPRRTLRLAAVGFIVALSLTSPVVDRVDAIDATGISSAAPEPSEPPVDEPPEEPTEPPVDDAPEGPTEPQDETAPADEPVLEPGGVPAAAWVGAILLLFAAVFWAVRHSSKPSSSPDG